MPTRILNYIIIASVIGIGVGLTREIVSPKKATTTNLATISITPTPPPQLTSSPLVPCQNKYFTFNKGTTWKYRLTTTNSAEKKTATTTDILTSTIIEASPSSILISTISSNDKKITTSKLECRQDGIYGLPVGFLPLDIAPIMQSLRLIPETEILSQDQPWTENISLDGLVQLPIPNLRIGLKSQVTSRSQKTLYNQTLSSLTISSTLQLPQQGLESFFNGNLLEYELVSGIGITQLQFNLNFKDISNLSIELSLISFSP